MAEQPSDLFSCSFSPGEMPDLTEFYFENDHEALKGNPDYLALVRTLSVLQAQKIQAINDIEALVEERQNALKDPIQFVERLQRGEQLKLPGKQTIAELPDIDWEKYHIPTQMMSRPETRNRNVGAAKDRSGHRPVESLEGLGCKVEKTSRGQFLVRGRVFDEKKPKTFNQPWSPEEQQRLEELLVEFPSEDVEMERWKKIANALGNRTQIQVQSRVQKYFLKLHKAGLPIPGKLCRQRLKYYKQGGSRSNNVYKKFTNSLYGQKNSTFFPNMAPSVKMDEEETDEQEEIFGGEEVEEEDVSDEEEVPEAKRSTKEYQELLWLKRIRRELEYEQQEGGSPDVHQGFRCDMCHKDPIMGTRWHCSQCIADVDFCNECAPKGFQCGAHLPEHKLRPIRLRKNRFMDNDYHAKAANNYLDPNFVK